MSRIMAHSPPKLSAVVESQSVEWQYFLSEFHNHRLYYITCINFLSQYNYIYNFFTNSMELITTHEATVVQPL